MDEQTDSKTSCDCGNFLGFLTLRLWLAGRAIITGLEKFAGAKSSDVAIEIDGAPNTLGLTASESEKVYSASNYHGVPEALYGQFEKEPLIPGFALKLYDVALGPLLLLVGLMVLLGIATRLSLFVMGLIYTSLTVGLILLKQDAGVAWLGIHVLLVAVALFKANDNKLMVPFLRKF
jgi:thiosulfate dehydrogenase [quinone] large subunit